VGPRRGLGFDDEEEDIGSEDEINGETLALDAEDKISRTRDHHDRDHEDLDAAAACPVAPPGEVPPSSLPLAAVGTGLLWVGWFGFNGGSALVPGTVSAAAVVNTQLAACTSALAWMLHAWAAHACARRRRPRAGEPNPGRDEKKAAAGCPPRREPLLPETRASNRSLSRGASPPDPAPPGTQTRGSGLSPSRATDALDERGAQDERGANLQIGASGGHVAQGGFVVSAATVLNGIVAGLAGVTPASGYVEARAGAALGLVVGLASACAAPTLKHSLRVDDALEVSVVHGLTGLLGSLAVGILSSSRVNEAAADGVLSCTMPVPGTPGAHGARGAHRSRQPDIHGGGQGIAGRCGWDLLAVQALAVAVAALWSAAATAASLRLLEHVIVRSGDAAQSVGPAAGLPARTPHDNEFGNLGTRRNRAAAGSDPGPWHEEKMDAGSPMRRAQVLGHRRGLSGLRVSAAAEAAGLDVCEHGIAARSRVLSARSGLKRRAAALAAQRGRQDQDAI
jgi:ammonia channel protein AmtB